MDTNQDDPVHAMILDGNAAAGILSEIFALEMTNNGVEWANCGHQGEIGTLLAFPQGPGGLGVVAGDVVDADGAVFGDDFVGDALDGGEVVGGEGVAVGNQHDAWSGDVGIQCQVAGQHHHGQRLPRTLGVPDDSPLAPPLAVELLDPLQGREPLCRPSRQAGREEALVSRHPL